MNNPVCPINSPYGVMLKADVNYMWCSCGLSKKQPYCDGSHKGTDFFPIKICFDKMSYINLCGCKKTKNPPYCDGSHHKV